MKVAVIYPPITKMGKYPLLGQNRQFRYSFADTVRIYPMVPATAATMSSEAGFDTLYLDGINLRLSMEEFNRRLQKFDPDLVLMETKTPIVKAHWEYINSLKEQNEHIKTALAGDHVTVNPAESLENSDTDFVLTGGDYDILFISLCRHLSNGDPLEPGIWYREDGRIKNTGSFQMLEDLDELPFIDRELTDWRTYGEAYLYRPVTYLLSGRGCGGGKRGVGNCYFCVWQHSLWRCTSRLRSPASVAEEIGTLVDKYKIKEIFDDNENGAVWNKKWLKEFHQEMKDRGLIGDVMISSNARADNLDEETCKLLKTTGYRLLKIGLESGNDETLKKLSKRETVSQIVEGVKNAKDHQLRAMLTIMVGYPWEKEEDVTETYRVARELIMYKTRFGDALQASMIIPYPGTPLHKLALKNNWFTIDPADYDKYDMSQTILETPIDANAWCDRMWSIMKEPEFIIKSGINIRSSSDFGVLYRGIRSIIAHTKDF